MDESGGLLKEGLWRRETGRSWAEWKPLAMRQCFDVDLAVGRSSQNFAKGANLSFPAVQSSFRSVHIRREEHSLDLSLLYLAVFSLWQV